MAYEVTWETPGEVLRLTMSGEMALNEFIEINGWIDNYLEESWFYRIWWLREGELRHN